MLALTCSAAVMAATSSVARPFLTEGSGDNRVIQFTQGEIAFANQGSIPKSGWSERNVPAIWLSDEARAKQKNVLSAWLRVRFDRADIGGPPVAIYTENNRERLTVFLNGVELFRNYKDDRSQTMGWNRPYILPLPQKLMREANNELVLKVVSNRQFSLGVGTVKIGSQNILGRLYSHQYFWRISGVAAANYAMLFLAGAVFLMWLARPKEHQLLWLCASGIAWFVRDFHFFAEEVLFHPFIFQQLSYYSLFFAVAFSLCFCAVFLNLEHRRQIIAAMLGVGIAISVFRIFAEQSNRTDLLTALLTLAMAMTFVALMIAHWMRSKSAETLILLITVAATTLSGLHDVGRSPHIGWWEGIGFHIQPFTGFLLFCVFLLSLGRRFIQALGTVEEMNLILEDRVETATAALEKSEQARQELAIEHAVGMERERLMREMHDGIGSNLVTALAVARKSNESPATVSTLERAITDLKLTVDSLAPVEGDVIALLANLRHRMEPDIERAGLKCVWQVKPCPPLLWLDATSALQMLRIIQEGVSNVLTHANATTIIIGCEASVSGEQKGITVSLKDNGRGFANTGGSGDGRGIANMKARAHSLAATLGIETILGQGTELKLWLPLYHPAFSRNDSVKIL
jgi:signal transduction histidine kinase